MLERNPIHNRDTHNWIICCRNIENQLRLRGHQRTDCNNQRLLVCFFLLRSLYAFRTAPHSQQQKHSSIIKHNYIIADNVRLFFLFHSGISFVVIAFFVKWSQRWTNISCCIWMAWCAIGKFMWNFVAAAMRLAIHIRIICLVIALV